MPTITARRHHDISCGHRVVGHEGKCANLHGHNYRFHFTCEADALDAIGRVIDFGVIKATLCQWLEDQWDHKMLIWEDDPWRHALRLIDPSIVCVSFNPTAENIARYMVGTVGPSVLNGTGVRLAECVVEETRKCAAGCAV